MAARANWKGYLRLSLVSCPIALFPATSESEKVRFNQLNKNTGNRIRYDEPVFEHDGELGFRLAPFARRHFPFRRRLTQDQIDEFCRGFVIGEVAADFDRPPELCVQSLNGVRRVDDPAYRLREGEEGNELCPSCAARLAMAGYFRPQGPESKASSAALPASASFAR